MVDTHDIAQLIKKHLEGTLMPEEQARLDAWVASAPENSAYFERIENGDAVLEDLKELHRLLGPEEAPWPEVLVARLNTAIGGVREKSAATVVPEGKARKWREFVASRRPKLSPQREKFATRALPYAAAIAILVTVGWLVWGDRWTNDSHQITATEILPGTNRATLTLADGRVIDLSSEQEGIIVSDENITYEDGVSSVVMLSANEASVNMLSLTTPRGGTYQITLPDGSRVWLNAGSTLKYPSRFSGEERIVDIVGEGYFQIEKDTERPFRVRSAGQTVQVLGTQFNISAYADEKETKTTLVEGKVRVDANGASLQLVPGEQGATTEKGLSKHEVNTEAYTAWKSGKFIFTGKPFTAVMAELARWYDLEVVYDGPVPEIAFFGGIHRNNNLSAVLKVLESAQVSYTVQSGNRLVIHHNTATGKEVTP